MRDAIWDIETYKNATTITFLDANSQKLVVFEMSLWKNDWQKFVSFTQTCSNGFVRWAGFNSYFFDYPIIHFLLKTVKSFHTGEQIAELAYNEAQRNINTPYDRKWDNVVYDSYHHVPQIDLFRIHHFDNVAKATSLKVLEFNMGAKSIQDLPYSPHTELTREQLDHVISYNAHDVKMTYQFYLKTLDMIRFREELSDKYDRNFLNHNDTKIGKDYFIMELENAGISCYDYTDEGRKPRQTKRSRIYIDDILFPYIKFKRPEFNAVVDWLKRQAIRETKGVFTEIEDLGSLEQYANLKLVKKKVKNLNCIVDGFQFDFGTGGIHGSVESTIVQEDDDYAIIDYDVTSLYPSIAIVNNVYPKHLGVKFCEIYSNMKKQRVSYAKGTPENAMLKLALNGVYGDSNNKFSPFYDPQYTMTITINGQLMLCMLAEKMMEIPNLEVIQINTDGVTIKVKRDDIDKVEQINREWEELTKLQLERADYSRMFIRDVNNYIGEYTPASAEEQGKSVKRKGAYEYKVDWHQNHSALVVKKAAEAKLINDQDISDFIMNHDNEMDFMLRTKVPRSSRLMLESSEEVLQNVTRYYVSEDGDQFVKVMPPLKGKTDERHIKIHNGWNATPMNDMGVVKNIEYDYYIQEANKLVEPLLKGVMDDLFD